MTDTANAPARARRRGVVLAGWLIGMFAVLAAAAVLAAKIRLPATLVDRALASQIRHTTGFTTKIHGSVGFALFPRPHVAIKAISFVNPKAHLDIKAASFTGYLRLLPLLIGRVEVGRAILYHPKLVIDLDDPAMTPESAIGRALSLHASSPQAASADQARLAIFQLVDGTARLTRHASPHDLVVRDINVTVDWRSLGASATLTGGFRFRDVATQLEAWVATPIALLRGGQSAASLHLRSKMLHVVASGTVSLTPQFQYRGQLVTSAPSLRKAVQWAGYSFGKHGRFGQFALQCEANVIANSAALTNLQLALDGNKYEGTLAVQMDHRGRPHFSGTLASDSIDVGPFLAGLPGPKLGYGGWSTKVLDLADLGFGNVDLRLSATRLHFDAMRIKDVALSVLAKPGLIDLALAQAKANGGTIRGHLTVTAAGKKLNLRLTGSATGVEIRPMLRGALVKHPLLGSLSGAVRLSGHGATCGALMHSLAGDVQVAVAGGRFVGVDLATALRSSKTSLASASGSSQDVTNFHLASLAVHINHGVAQIANGQIRGNAMAVRFGGAVNLGARSLDLWALARSVPSPADPHIGVPLWLSVKGPWSDMHLMTDRPPPTALPPAAPPRRVGAMESALSAAPTSE